MKYQSGFGNHFATEAINGALPVGQNNPQKAPFGLYAEQLSGTAFTAPQSENRRSWLYRIRPSVCHEPFTAVDKTLMETAPLAYTDTATPQQMRWDPLSLPKEKMDFISGLHTICVAGSAAEQTGSAVHIYVCNTSMVAEYFYNSDGEMMVLPQLGALRLRTEFGEMEVAPGEMVVIPRGVKFQVVLKDKTARGYVCENYGRPFRLPERGPIGSNGLANQRDFLFPVAAYEEKEGDFRLTTKFHGRLWSAKIGHSPFDVVAWHGNYAPYKYDLKNFNVIGTVSFDHPDPSIFTVLTSPSHDAGTANVDFVIFPPRWMVAEHTFRTPWYHRNVMSEYMGVVYGRYDAKEEGFDPGGGSLHNCMSAHGPDVDGFEKATNANLKPVFLGETMVFMFESRTVYVPTCFALTTPALQKDYWKCWLGLKKKFKRTL